MKTWNHYICQKCKGITVAKHETDGVTPFGVQCRARYGCDGLASSLLFRCSQDDRQIPHIIFYRPPKKLAMEFIQAIENPHQRAWYKDHYENGGSLMRIASGSG